MVQIKVEGMQWCGSKSNVVWIQILEDDDIVSNVNLKPFFNIQIFQLKKNSAKIRYICVLVLTFCIVKTLLVFSRSNRTGNCLVLFTDKKFF